MQDISSEIIDDFVDGCHRAAAEGLMQCSSGNVSMRVDENRMLVSASRSWLADLTPQDVAVCLIADGSFIAGPKPTVELGFHAGILRTRQDVNVVIHFQTPCATVLACQDAGVINYNVIPEIPFYIGPIARIPYVLPGSQALAVTVTEAMQEHDLVVMTNHGQATAARDMSHAIQNAAFFELASEIVLRNGDRVVTIPEDEVNALLEMRRAVHAEAPSQDRAACDTNGKGSTW